MRDISRLLAPLALTLACLALAVRIVAPQGFMVAPAGQASLFPVVLCTGQGVATAYLDDRGRPAPPRDEPSGEHAPCVFAGTAAVVLEAPPAMIFGITHAWPPAAPAAEPAAAPGRGLSAPPPPQTGPPARA